MHPTVTERTALDDVDQPGSEEAALFIPVKVYLIT